MDENTKKNSISTGTTLVGIVCKDGIVMAADNRVTLGGQVIVGKDFEKVYQINKNLVFSGCGSLAETQKIAKLLTAELRLKELRSRETPTVKQAAALLSNINASASAFLLAGFDESGAYLYEITGGSLSLIKDYTSSVGSGFPYVLGFLERQYKKDLSIKEGVELAIESIKASSARDTASGNGVDVYTITKDGIQKVSTKRVEYVYKDEKE